MKQRHDEDSVASAEEAGRWAYAAGDGIDDCPYHDPARRSAWIAGYTQTAAACEPGGEHEYDIAI